MVFPQSPGLTAALILYTSAPPNFAAAALAFILGLDGALPSPLILGALILHPILTPLFTELVTGGAVLVPGSEIALRLALLIGGAPRSPLRRPAADRQGAPGRGRPGHRWRQRRPHAGLRDRPHGRDPGPDRRPAGPCAGAHRARLRASPAAQPRDRLVFWGGPAHRRHHRLSLGGRNIAPAMAVLGTAVPGETWLFFAVLQFPIYLLPMLLKPIYRRLLVDTHPS
jgi:hypothetical protein